MKRFRRASPAPRRPGVALALLVALSHGTPAAAGLRALLVGVSGYDHLDGLDLRGPRNDVALMAAALIARGADPAAIVVLADGAAGLDPAIRTARPTRAEIMAELDRLAAVSGPGDTVVFYYSGHGSQAPDRDGDEGGGMDEILLPADVRGWSGRRGMVENAILDDELNAAARAILARGAAMVGIVDACHSGTSFRAVPGAGVARSVDPAILGIPGGADAAPAGPRAGRPRSDEPLPGDFVFLYAAQSDQRAWEYPQGPADDPAAWHGEFTRALVAVLTLESDPSWAQLMRAAMKTMRRDAAGRPVQTPDAEGTLLDAPVLGAAAGGAARLAVAGEVLAAGRLHGIDPGAVVAIYAGAAGGAPLGRARVVAAEAATARLAPEDGLALPARGHAVLVAPGAPPPLRVSAPARADAGDGHDYRALLAALAVARVAAAGIAFDAADFDLGLVLAGGVLVLTGPDGVVDPRGPGSSPRLAPEAAGDLPDLLARAGRVERLRRTLTLAERAAARSFTVLGPPIRMEVERIAGRADGGDCAEAAGPAERPFDLRAQPVAHCDELRLHLSNGSSRAQDVTVLYVDRDFRVAALWPLPGQGNRIEGDTGVRVRLQVTNPDGLALEELIVIAVPAVEGRPRTDLSGLADPVRVRGEETALESFLRAAIDPDAPTRSFAARPAAPGPVTVLRTALAVRATDDRHQERTTP